MYIIQKNRGDSLKVASQSTLNNTIYERFLMEKNALKNLVYEEILVRKSNSDSCSYSIDFINDAIYVIDKGFDDILKNINESNIEEKEIMLKNFKESFMYAIYES